MRKDCFFGVHMDMHASKATVISKIEEFDLEVFRFFLDRVAPEFLQVDSKGHDGYSSYDTKYGQKPDVFIDDRLPLIREETKKRGILLYGHHSGVFDNVAIKTNPEWAALDREGNASFRFGSTSVFGEYVDKRLIPQLKELALDFQLDGAWLDGECWAAEMEFSPMAIQAYKNKFEKDPDLESESGLKEYRDFCRQGFFDYVKRVADELKAVAPHFEITSNWAKSSSAPTAQDLHLPFLSGDLSPNNSVFWAKVESIFLAQNNMPWDIMAWGFLYNGSDAQKSAVQLEQELALIASFGGGVQVYVMQTMNKMPRAAYMVDVLEDVAKFAKPRKYLHGLKQEKEVGVFYGVQEYYDNCKKYLLQEHNDYYLNSLNLLDCVSTCGYSTNVVLDEAKVDLSAYATMIVPSYTLKETDVERLLVYAKSGGNLLVLGDAAKQFAKRFDIQVSALENKFIPVKYKNECVGLGSYVETYCFESHNNNSILSCFKSELEEGEEKYTALELTYGEGRIVLCGFDFGKEYKKTRSVRFTHCLEHLIAKEKSVQVNSRSVFVNVLENGKQRIVNLVNVVNGIFNNENIIFDELPALGDLRVQICAEKKPVSVKLLPENTPLEFTYENGKVICDGLSVHIHSSVVLDFD